VPPGVTSGEISGVAPGSVSGVISGIGSGSISGVCSGGVSGLCSGGISGAAGGGTSCGCSGDSCAMVNCELHRTALHLPDLTARLLATTSIMLSSCYIVQSINFIDKSTDVLEQRVSLAGSSFGFCCERKGGAQMPRPIADRTAIDRCLRKPYFRPMQLA
jgi:hypothetical protein